MTNYTIIRNETITSYLSDKAFRLYTLLESMAYGSKIQVYPSQRFLACALRCSVRTIQRALIELKKANLISIRRRGSISNVYTLLEKKIQQTVQNIKDKMKSRENSFKGEKTTKKTNHKNNYNNKFKKDKFNDFEQRANLEKHNNKMDYIMTHTCSSSTLKDITEVYGFQPKPEDAVNKYLEIIEGKVKFRKWYFGHFHEDIEIDEKHTLVFEKIIKIQ
ncbi:hypothetical protein CF067_00725 [Clostridium sporogenes]